MKSLIYKIVCKVYGYTLNKNRWEFVRLFFTWVWRERYQMFNDVAFLNYKFDVPDSPSFTYQFKEIFVDEIYNFSSNKGCPIIYDCGANIGISCLYFKNIFPGSKIKAFEADPIIADILRNNLAKNNINDVEVINKAVWIDCHGIEFGVNGADGGSINAVDNKITIDSIRLKDFIDSEECIDLLKIDIEGAEYSVLEDCRNSLSRVKHLFIEYHSWSHLDQNLSQILDIFEENGFRFYIENLTHRKHPLINYGLNNEMDLQLNIFGTRL
jgi:FkbM family methyltransferase